MKKYSDYRRTKFGNKSKSERDLTPEEFKNVVWANFKIVVPTEDDKKELMDAFEHFHSSEIDTDIIAVNQLAHQYQRLNNIVVDNELYEKLTEDEDNKSK